MGELRESSESAYYKSPKATLTREDLKKYAENKAALKAVEYKISSIEAELEYYISSGAESIFSHNKQMLIKSLHELIPKRLLLERKLYEIEIKVENIPNKRTRDIIHMHYIKGMDIKEIAAKTKSTRDAIYKVINRCFPSTKS